MTLRVSALFENNVELLLLNFYRHRAGGGRRTRQRYHAPADNQPGPSGVTSQQSSATPRVCPEASTSAITTRASTTPRSSASTRPSTRRHNDGAGPSNVPTESLRMRISLATGSVVSATGLGDLSRTDGGSPDTATSSATRQRASEVITQNPVPRVTTRSRASVSSVSSVQSSVPDTPTTAAAQNGHMTRYSTRSRVPKPRYDLNGVSDTAEQDSEDEEEEEEDDDDEEDSEETGGESSDTSTTQDRRNSNRSGKSSGRKTVNKKNSSQKGKQVVTRRRPSPSESEERGRTHARRGLRTRMSTRYNDSASESDDERSSNTFLGISSRGRVRRKAARMVDYVN